MHVVLNNLTLMAMGKEGLLHSCSNFQKAVQASALRLLRSVALVATIHVQCRSQISEISHMLDGLPYRHGVQVGVTV